MSVSDTIAAIATARGPAALAVVRISGPTALEVAAQCFLGADLSEAATQSVHVGYWHTSEGQRIDQVVCTVFRAPRSVTGEDVVEVSCHGGDYIAPRILTALLQCGARLALPGEFTKRAFLSGKIDLAQAEAVADLIQASNARAHQTSVAALEGHYSKVLEALRQSLLEVCALAELEIDFTDEDVTFADRREIEELINKALNQVTTLLDSCQLGEFVREGIRVVIAGRPNAGKSTLLNSLCGRDRAIVSPSPGTTRDTLEADAEFQGLRFRFIDTAGLRESQDEIEREGVARAKTFLARADVIIYVYDLTIGLADAERATVEASKQVPLILVGNKLDLVDRLLPLPDTIMLSAKNGPDAVKPLVASLLKVTTGHWSDFDASRIVMNVRHQGHLALAQTALVAAKAALEAGRSPDVYTLDLRAAARELGMITGAITNEEVLSAIFSRFCIGK